MHIFFFFFFEFRWLLYNTPIGWFICFENLKSQMYMLKFSWFRFTKNHLKYKVNIEHLILELIRESIFGTRLKSGSFFILLEMVFWTCILINFNWTIFYCINIDIIGLGKKQYVYIILVQNIHLYQVNKGLWEYRINDLFLFLDM